MLRTMLIVSAVAAVAGIPTSGHAGQAEAERRASPRLIAETGWLTAGETAQIAVTFRIDPRWHLYSPTQNETGGPPTFEFTLPEGFSLGEPIWPAPQRHVMDYGEVKILDHIYEEELTVIFPLQVPDDAKAGSTAAISAKLDWVVCSDTCVFESDQVSLTLPIAAGGDDPGWSPAPAADVSSFKRARMRHAKPLPKQSSPVTVTVKSDEVVFTAAGAEFMAFYPAATGLPLADLADSGEAKGGTLTIPIGSAAPGAASGAAGADATRVRGILETRTTPKGRGRFWQIDEPSDTLEKGR